jgi:hypothetical protein
VAFPQTDPTQDGECQPCGEEEKEEDGLEGLVHVLRSFGTDVVTYYISQIIENSNGTLAYTCYAVRVGCGGGGKPPPYEGEGDGKWLPQSAAAIDT